MDLYLGSPHRMIHPMSPGYALSHEMSTNFIIERYCELPKLILDNGADELGEGERGTRLAYLAGRLRPEYLILPDVLHKDKKTRKRGIEFYEEMRNAGYTGKFIGVIQAKTLEQGLDSYKFWDRSGLVDRVGVTYDTKIETVISNTLPSWGKRLGFLEFLTHSSAFTNGRGTGVHMLGTLEVNELYTLTRDIRFEKVLDLVVSHDTTAPYACPTRFRANRNGIFFGREKNWERLDFSRTYSSEELTTAEWNVACYLAACMVPKEQWSLYLGQVHADMLWPQFEQYYA